MKLMRSYFNGIRKDRYVLLSLLHQDIRSKYRGSFLGAAWSVLTPLGLSIIIGGIYSIIFHVEAKTFIPLLFSGLNPWNYLSACANNGTFSYFAAEGYLKQTQVTPQIFPLRVAGVAFVDYLYGMLAFFIVYFFLAPGNISPVMLMVIPGSVLLFLGGVALANLSAGITLYVRDFRPLQGLLLQGFFYITPIVYTTEMLDNAGFSIIYRLNPFYYFIDVIRSPAMGNALPSPEIYLCTALLALLLLLLSICITVKVSHGIALKL